MPSRKKDEEEEGIASTRLHLHIESVATAYMNYTHDAPEEYG
jgi:hypothetical protein